MKKYFEILKKCTLFNDIADDNLFAMLGCLNAKIKKFSKGQIIFQEGAPPKYIGIILKGKAQIVRDDYYGNRSIVTVIEEGELFGESFVFANVKAFPISVIADAETEVMLIDGKRITVTCNNACEFHNKIIFNLLRIVANKNLIFNQKIEITSKRTTKEKLMSYLLLQAKKNNCDEFIIPYDRQALADYLDVERSAMSAEISKLKKEKIIDTKKNWFKIL